jgi:hypothetical protein
VEDVMHDLWHGLDHLFSGSFHWVHKKSIAMFVWLVWSGNVSFHIYGQLSALVEQVEGNINQNETNHETLSLFFSLMKNVIELMRRL